MVKIGPGWVGALMSISFVSLDEVELGDRPTVIYTRGETQILTGLGCPVNVRQGDQANAEPRKWLLNGFHKTIFREKSENFHL